MTSMTLASFYHRMKAYGAEHEKLSFFIGAILTMVIVVLTTILNLTTMNTQASKGYVLNELEAERQILTRDGEVTEMMILQASSMNYLQEAPSVKRMRAAQSQEIVFVAPISVFAQR